MLYAYLWNRLRRVRLDRTARFRILAAILLIVLGSLIFPASNPVPLVFSEPPPFAVEWEVLTFYNNHIGGRIGAILRITSVPGVRVRLDNLPQVGDVVGIKRYLVIESNEPRQTSPTDPFYLDPYRFPSTRIVEEGELEVRERRITVRREGESVVTEVYYDFQYLLPIDFEQAFNLKLLPRISVSQLFQMRSKWGTANRSSTATVDGADFYIARRVDEESIPPILRFRELIVPPGSPYYLRLAGAGILVGAVAAQLWVSVVGRVRRKWSADRSVPEASPPPTLMDLYIRWGRTGEYGVFLEAVKLYRAGTWGKPNPRRWVESTFVLYSGVVFSDSRVARFFTELMEVADEPVS